MNTATRLRVLKEIYAVYDEVVAANASVCEPRCSACCTTDITATTIEAFLIVADGAGLAADMRRHLQEAATQTRFKPLLSINTLADICGRGQTPPAETTPAGTGVCPFLAEQLCSIYAVRPFGCRSMTSRTDCRQQGYATMDDARIATNELFMQYIEHIDAHGRTGNLIDVLLLLETSANQQAYQEGNFEVAADRLPANRPIRFLATAAGHRGVLEPIIERLNQINIASSE